MFVGTSQKIGGSIVAVLLLAGVTTLPALAAKDRTLAISNKSARQVSALMAQPSDMSSPAVDVLAGKVLTVGETRQLTIASPTDFCAFNLVITFGDGTTKRLEAVDFCNTDAFVVEK